MPNRRSSYDIDLKRSLSASIQKKMAENNLSINALAQRMGTGRTAVRRLLDGKNTSITFRSMSRAAQAVGLKIKLVAEPMSPEELGKLGRRLARAKTSKDAAAITNEITKGFYAGS